MGTFKLSVDTEEGVIQDFGEVIPMPIALNINVCKTSVASLNRLLADTATLRDMYKKHHWQVTGSNFYSLHLMFDAHYGAQADLVDKIAERIQQLGGVSLAMAGDISLAATIPAVPKGREKPFTQLSRLVEAHRIILEYARLVSSQTAQNGDDGTNDLMMSEVIRTNEKQVLFVSSHLMQI